MFFGIVDFYSKTEGGLYYFIGDKLHIFRIQKSVIGSQKLENFS